MVVFIVCYSGCSIKDDFYRGMYEVLQNNNFCTNTQECQNKKLNLNSKISFDKYKQETQQQF